jgi:hypothetical protein
MVSEQQVARCDREVVRSPCRRKGKDRKGPREKIGVAKDLSFVF